MNFYVYLTYKRLTFVFLFAVVIVPEFVHNCSPTKTCTIVGIKIWDFLR